MFLLFFFLNIKLGPWFVGHIIDQSIGVCFVWGIFLAGTFLPGGLTYFAGTAYVRTFTFLLSFLYVIYSSIFLYILFITSNIIM